MKHGIDTKVFAKIKAGAGALGVSQRDFVRIAVNEKLMRDPALAGVIAGRMSVGNLARVRSAIQNETYAPMTASRRCKS